jgi:hypothetical protein
MESRMKRMTTFALTLLPLPLLAQEWTTLSCLADGGEPFEVMLGNPSELGAPLHCLSSHHLGNLGACAPDGGWGLSDPAPPGELLRITEEPANAAAHEGGKLSAYLGPSEFVASASEGPGLPLALEVHGATFWRIRVALETGQGIIETRKGVTAIRCMWL